MFIAEFYRLKVKNYLNYRGSNLIVVVFISLLLIVHNISKSLYYMSISNSNLFADRLFQSFNVALPTIARVAE